MKISPPESKNRKHSPPEIYSPKVSPLKTKNPKISPAKTNNSENSLLGNRSPDFSPVETSLEISPLDSRSPDFSPVETSPEISPLDSRSPEFSPVETSPEVSPLTRTPEFSPLDTSLSDISSAGVKMPVSVQQAMPRSMTTQYINERVDHVPLRILNRGPEYIRSRMMDRDSALFRHNRRSAVELLAESKLQYVKSPTTSPENKLQQKNRLSEGCENRERSISYGTADNNGLFVSHSPRDTAHSLVTHPTQWDGNHVRMQRSASSPTAVGLRSPDQAVVVKPQTPTVPGTTHQSILEVTLTKSTSAVQEPCIHHYSSQPLITGHDVTDGPCKPPVAAKPVVPPKPTIPSKPPVPAKPIVAKSSAIRPSTLPTVSVETGSAEPVTKDRKHPCYRGAVRAMANSINSSHSMSKTDIKCDIPGTKHDVTGIKCDIPFSKSSIPDIKGDIPHIKCEFPVISMDEWRDNQTDDSSAVDDQSSDVVTYDSATIVRRRHCKAISRSRSDLTKRLSSSSDFSELSARFHRNSADLEKFFNEMGLDQNVLEPLKLGQSANLQSCSSLNLFESVSRLGSTDARSCLSDDSYLGDGHPRASEGGDRTPGGSIVERNARIIKWLCGIKMASSSHGNQQTVSQQKGLD